MMHKFSAFILFLILGLHTFGQDKKIIDHTAYNQWKRISDVVISPDGKFSCYAIKPHRGDGYLFVVENETGKKDSIFRGESASFSGSSAFLVFKITPGFDTLRTCELNKIKKEKWPKDTLAIYDLSSKKTEKIALLKSVKIAENTDWIAFLQDKNELPEGKKKKQLFGFLKRKKEVKKPESDGNLLTLLHLTDSTKFQFKNVTELEFAPEGNAFYFVAHQKEKIDSNSLFTVVLNSKIEPKKLGTSFVSFGGITFNKAGTELSFLASQDTAKLAKNYALYSSKLDGNSVLLIDTVNANLPEGMTISKHFKPNYSYDGTKLFVGIAKTVKPEPKDSLLENEKAKVDLWHWKDDRLQPQQLLELKRDEKKTALSVYDFSKSKLQVLGNDTLRVQPLDHGNSEFAIGTSVKPYQLTYQWQYPTLRDLYRVEIATGKASLLKSGTTFDATISPSGRYYTYFDTTDLHSYVVEIQSNSKRCVTCSEKSVDWLEDINGMPIVPSPVGILGFTKDEKAIVIQSKYDVWNYDLETSTLSSITKKQGEKQKIRLQLNTWERDSSYISPENSYITGFHEDDKSMSFYIHSNSAAFEFRSSLASPHAFVGFKKAKRSDAFVYQKHSLQDYPDLHVGKLAVETLTKQISFANPQQNEYNWATVELINWKSYSGENLEGLLYKPENYDPSKSYPLLVYFYEMYSDELHNHYAPRPTASIIFPTEYASAGYFVLIPDIRYKPGYPARGAYDCIMSGTDHVLKMYKSIDSTRMGLQGQSWGGYQTAQLITMTKRYKAAMAGAPVSNMFSAYGGIRWGSGLNRQFQYEHTQSRIGKTIWEAPELYIENSPLFHLPKVQTPLLIMHNDADGAVPWYQGIELYTGLRRLQKPVWMLNYNDDDHNLMKNANRFDLSVRMRQFFDHYLLNQPAPTWLLEGIPATEKGKVQLMPLK